MLNSVKVKLNKDEYDTELFNIYLLIDNSKMCLIISKSIKFNEALRKLEEMKSSRLVSF